MVTEKEKINRHLAVYEQLNLQVKSIGVWPMALAKTYTSFFGRRKTDEDAVVLLVDIEPNYSNIVICRHLNLLFARSIPIGTSQLEDDKAVQTFVLELTGCRRHFDAMYKEATIERMIFMNGSGASVATAGAYATIARKMEMPAQMGDCMAAVEMPSTYESGIDRRGCNFSWATTFGLSLL
jgi:hypothetical protein